MRYRLPQWTIVLGIVVFLTAINSSTIQASSLTAAPTSVAPGQSITVTWTGLTATGNDWISLHPVTDGNSNSNYLDSKKISGTSGTISFTAPAAGSYNFRLFRNGPRDAVSNTVQVVTVPPPNVTIPPPQDGSVSIACTGTSLRVTWTAIVTDDYYLQVSTTPNRIVSNDERNGSFVTVTGTPQWNGVVGNVTSKELPGVVPGTTYYALVGPKGRVYPGKYTVYSQMGSTTCAGQNSIVTPQPQVQVGIRTDKLFYKITDRIQVCYTLSRPAYVRLTNLLANGTSQLLREGNDDGTGDCLSGTITGPTGSERVRIDAWNRQSDSLIIPAVASATAGYEVLPEANQQCPSGETVPVSQSCPVPVRAPAWRILVLIYGRTDAVIQDGDLSRHVVAELSETEQQRAADAARAFVYQDIPALTSGVMAPELEVRYPGTLHSLTPFETSTWWPTPSDVAADLDPSFDSVIVLWGHNAVDVDRNQGLPLTRYALSQPRGDKQTYLEIPASYVTGTHRNFFKHEWGHSILSYFDAINAAPKPAINNHINSTDVRYLSCRTGGEYVLRDESLDAPIPNSIYNNAAGFTHDYYSGFVASPGSGVCLGVTREAWMQGGPAYRASQAGTFQVSTVPEAETPPTHGDEP